MKTIVISDQLHEQLKNHCTNKKIKIGEYIEQVLQENVKFTLQEKSQLPLILKDSTQEVVETLICNYLSSEFKNNMPKELTLLRTTRDGAGFIGNYFQK